MQAEREQRTDAGIAAAMEAKGAAPVEVANNVYWVPAGNPFPEYPSFAAAIVGARERQRPLPWGGHTREFVALRQRSTYAPPQRPGSGADRELLRWEVFPSCVVLVPEGAGGLSEAQRDAVLAPADGAEPDEQRATYIFRRLEPVNYRVVAYSEVEALEILEDKGAAGAESREAVEPGFALDMIRPRERFTFVGTADERGEVQ